MQGIIRTNNAATLAILNRGKKADVKKQKEIKAMGLAAYQGLCISYGVHSKAFCH